jgi:multicomponent Na+:H+ antiporter subunit E
VRVFFWLHYLLIFLPFEIIKANIQVAIAVLSPANNVKPGIVAVPTELETEWGIMLLANSITLTPGTITLDVSKNKKVLYVHCLALENPESFVQSIKDVFEKKILRLEKPHQ